MRDSGEIGSVLDSLPEPAFLVRPGGALAWANRAARALFDQPLIGCSIAELGAEDAAATATYVARCSGSSRPLPGRISVRDRSGKQRQYRAYGHLVRPRSGAKDALVLLRCVGNGDERFSALARQNRKLNAEIRKHQHTQGVLETALRERDLLLRELHHRVRNNLQMLLAMLSMGRADATNAEMCKLLDDAYQRIATIGIAQNVLYGSPTLASVSGRELLDAVAENIAPSLPTGIRLSAEATGNTVPNDLAVPVALVLNELIMNAVQHGFVGRAEGKIEVRLGRESGNLTLSIADDGAGFKPSARSRRASGLGLVRSLMAQLGGTLEMDSAGGTHCVIQVPVRVPEHDACVAGQHA